MENKKKGKKGSKLLALLLSVMMVITMMPAMAWADTEAEGDTEAVTPKLASLKVTNYQGTSEYTMTPDFDPDVLEYTATVPDYLSSVTAAATIGEAYTGKRLCYYGYNSMFGGFGWSSSNSVNISKGYFGVVIYDQANRQSDEDIRYTVNVAKYPTLKGLTVDGLMDKSFNRDETSYHVYVNSKTDGVDISATSYKADYTLTIGGSAAVSGTAFHLSYDWKEDGTMEVPVVVTTADGSQSYTYTLNLEKEPLSDVPTILTQPVRADYIQGASASALSFWASASGDMTYQWYKNSVNSAEGAEAIEGASEATYTPDTSATGTAYYFCKITNADTGSSINTAIVDIVTDPDPTPSVTILNTVPDMPDDGYTYTQEKGYCYAIGETSQPLQASCTSAAEGGSWALKWIMASNSTATYGTFLTVSSETSEDGKTITATASPLTDASTANNEGKWYVLQAKYTFKGKTYTTYSDRVYVFTKANSAAAPVISSQPVSAEYILGETASKLSVSAAVSDQGSLSYQWYQNSVNSKTGATAINGATAATYTPAAPAEPGTTYYFCKVTNTLQQYTASTVSQIASVKFKNISEVVGTAFEGSGTEEAPFLLKTAEDFETLRQYVNNSGIAFEGVYFKLADDISLPADWAGLGTGSASGNGKEIKTFSGHLNGDGHTITFAFGSKPLFYYARETYVENLNIYGAYIAGNGLVANYVVDYGTDGNYNTGCPKTLTADNVTIKSGTVIKNSGFIGGYASGVNTITLTNCTVEKDVKIGYDAENNQPTGSSRIGSFGGDFNGTITNCSSAATVYGNNYVGGIVGGKGQTVGSYSIRNCVFTGEIIATGQFVGGIAGGGYSGSGWGVASAPNTPCANVENCYVKAAITGSHAVGGILGGEEGSTQNWGNAYIRNNVFTGTVTATAENGMAGGIIGYMNSINAKNVIENNYYLETSASKGIGGAGYVDTSASSHETASGAKYFNSAVSVTDITDGINKKDHNRTDDPLGADADKLAAGLTSEEMKAESLLTALNSGDSSFHNWVADEEGYPVISATAVVYSLTVEGTYKDTYYLGDDLDLSGAVITAKWSDGTTSTVDEKDLEIRGYDKNTRGVQTVTLAYGAASAEIKVTVLKQDAVADNTITVYFTLRGDSVHDSDSDGTAHTLASGNLTTWIAKKGYKVDQNATVRDVFEQALSAAGYAWSNLAGNYIEGITTPDGTYLGEFTNGKLSGWMYTLNGVHPENAVNEQYLEDGDVIVFHYTDDYTKEKGTDKWTDSATGSGTGTAVLPEDTSTESPADETLDAEAVKALMADLTPVARSVKTANRNVKVTVKLDAADKAIIEQIEDAGYTVKYNYYRSAKKSSKYSSMLMKDGKTYTNTIGKKSTMYYYKVRIQVYDQDGSLVGRTALKQCRYANRLWTKK